MTTTAEGVGIRTTGIDHARIRTNDLARARVFYLVRLGFPLVREDDRQFVFRAGTGSISVHEQTVDGEPPSRAAGTGLDVISLLCEDSAELRRVSDALTRAGIEHSGVRVDHPRGAEGEYLAFKDPDGMQWELRPMR